MRTAVVPALLTLVSLSLVVAGPGAAQKGPIKIGFVTSETGFLAANGKDMINGLQLFPTRLPAVHALLGRR